MHSCFLFSNYGSLLYNLKDPFSYYLEVATAVVVSRCYPYFDIVLIFGLYPGPSWILDSGRKQIAVLASAWGIESCDNFP